MERFLKACKDFGVDSPGRRSLVLRASILLHNEETVLYLICGHDFIFHPSDQKFEGIREVFINENGPLHLNIADPLVRKINASLSNPSVNASMEGMPGVRANFNPANMRQTGGIRANGAANYNLQTKALELTMDFQQGLHQNDFLGNELRRLQQKLAGPLPILQGNQLATVTELKSELRPYWGQELPALWLA